MSEFRKAYGGNLYFVTLKVTGWVDINMELKFTNKGPAISEKDIFEVEEKYNVKLPGEYKEFLIKYNGGTPTKIYFVKENQNFVINFFLSLFVEDLSFEEYFLDYKINSKLLPERMVPIAEDAFGNAFCISISGNDCGKIFFWDHEDSSSGLIFMANSFNEFLKELKDDIPD